MRETERDVALLAEFDSVESILHAVTTLRAKGYQRMEAYTPHPIPELEERLGIPRSTIPRFVLAGGVIGGLFAFGLQWWLNGVDYPLNVGGRPLFSAPAFIPITFETIVLFAALTGFATFLYKTRLPTLQQPLLAVEGFERVSIDKFWLALSTSDPLFDPKASAEQLRALGAERLVRMPEVDP